MNFTLDEFVVSLQRLNGLQHLGQMAGYHLMVDESDLTYWQSHPCSAFQSVGGAFDTAHQAWFDCLYTNFNRKLLLAMWMLAEQGQAVHPQAVEAFKGWMAQAKPKGGQN